MNDFHIYSEEVILHPCGDIKNLPKAERFYIYDEKSREELPFKFKTAEQAIFFILNREPRQQLRLINRLEKMLEEKNLFDEQSIKKFSILKDQKTY